MEEFFGYKISFYENKEKKDEEDIEMRVVYPSDTHIHEYENKQASIEYALEESQVSLELTFTNIDKHLGEYFEKIYGWNTIFHPDKKVNPLVVLDQSNGITFSQYVNKFEYKMDKIRVINEFLNTVCKFIDMNTSYKTMWWFGGTYDPNFMLIMKDSKRKTLEWLAIKHRLIEKGYNKNDLKIQIGWCYYYNTGDPAISNPYERYPIYLNVCEPYHSSFRFSTDKKYNAARSIFELIIYKEEWYDSMYFKWDTDALDTYKSLFFKNHEEFAKENALADEYDSEFEYMCWEEEKEFRG